MQNFEQIDSGDLLTTRCKFDNDTTIYITNNIFMSITGIVFESPVLFEKQTASQLKRQYRTSPTAVLAYFNSLVSTTIKKSLDNITTIVVVSDMPMLYRLFKMYIQPTVSVKYVPISDAFMVLSTNNDDEIKFNSHYCSQTSFNERNDVVASQIVNGIYIGCAEVATSAEELAKIGISAIVNCTCTVENKFEDKITYLTVPIRDVASENIIDYFDQTFDFIEDQLSKGKNVLVHCAAGISRSVSIVIAYLMRKNRLKMEDAFYLVKSKRDRADPNFGFVCSLREYEVRIGC